MIVDLEYRDAVLAAHPELAGELPSFCTMGALPGSPCPIDFRRPRGAGVVTLWAAQWAFVVPAEGEAPGPPVGRARLVVDVLPEHLR